eukprot:g28205.t1
MADQATLKALRNKLGDLEERMSGGRCVSILLNGFVFLCESRQDELDSAHEAKAELEAELKQVKSDLEAAEQSLASARAEARESAERCEALKKLQEEQEANSVREKHTEVEAEASASRVDDSLKSDQSLDQDLEKQRLEESVKQEQVQLLQETLQRQQLEVDATKQQEAQLQKALEQEKQNASSLCEELQQLKKSLQEEASATAAQANKLKVMEEEYRRECQRLQQLCQELESATGSKTRERPTLEHSGWVATSACIRRNEAFAERTPRRLTLLVTTSSLVLRGIRAMKQLVVQRVRLRARAEGRRLLSQSRWPETSGIHEPVWDKQIMQFPLMCLGCI